MHGGANHDRLTLPAYGGSLFDPDRYPFLEGRRTPDHIIVNGVDFGPGDDTAAGPGRPVAIDDRTVLAILEALLNVKVRVGRATVTQRVSYKALDVEQIGHCYEGLLDHGCAPIDVLSLGLIGAEGGEPEIAITDLEARLSAGTDALCGWLEDKTRCNKKASALAKELERRPDGIDLARLRVACGHDDASVERVLPFWGLIRTDLRGLPVILLPGSKYVIQTSTRRNMGAEYTTKALAEEVVRYALEPLVYDPGPQNEADPENWRLKTPAEILDLRVCDPAVGSGAILTAAGRFLGDRLIESVTEHGAGESHFASRLSDIAAAPADEQTLLARREVVDHCLYGVDKNPVAAEMAKLSLWLTTMARERPFTFLDHAIQVGDSLLGITDLEQLRWLHLNPAERKGNAGFEALTLDLRIKEAAELAQRLQKLSVVTVRDATEKKRLHDELRAKLADLAVVADTVVGAALSTAGIPGISMEQRLDTQLDRIVAALDDDRPVIERTAALDVLRNLSTGWLRTDLPDEPPMPWDRQCLHWPLAFPEVFVGNARWGFDAFVANPPYMGNKYWKERVGGYLQPFYAKLIGVPLRKPDLIVLFMWRFKILLSPLGTVGALATQSISEVDSKALMADHVLDSLGIHRAVRSRQWPGEASIVVSQLWMHRGTWNLRAILDGVQVDGIGADLQPVGVALEPAVLADRLFAFQGIDNSRGGAFILDSGHELTQYTDLCRPFVSGEDISQADPLRPKRFILDLTGWSEDRLADLPEPVRRYVFEVVRPTRTPEELKSYPNLAKRWWTFWRTVEDLFARSRTTPICVAMPAIAKYLVPLALPSSWAFSNKAIVVQVERRDTHAILLSPAFDVWARKFGGSMGAGRVMKIASVIDTFPLPKGEVDQSLADEWQHVLISCIQSNGTNATDVLNRVADEQDQEQEIVKLRSLYSAIHVSVSAAYGWDVVPWLPLTPNDVSASAMLTRLLLLNEEQHNRELLAGINTKSRKRTVTVASRVAEPPSSQERLL